MTTFVKATQAYQQGQRTLPGRYYNAPEIWAEERERIFARRWICVGRAAELGQPGDYAVRAVGGESVMVVRGQDSAVRAFYNVGRHRGTRLCETERGRLSETIQCPYHAWTYTLDGTLIGAPHMNEVAGVDKRDYPPHQIAPAEREPDDERAGVRAGGRRPAGGRPESRLLLHDFSQSAAVAPPGLRDVPHAVAAVA